MFDISFHTNVDNKKQLFSYVLDDVIIVRKDYPQILKIKKQQQIIWNVLFLFIGLLLLEA